MNVDCENQLKLLFKYPLVTLKNRHENEEVYEGNILCQYKINNIVIKHQQLDARNHMFQVTVPDKSAAENALIQEMIENNKFQSVVDVLDKVKMYLETQNGPKTVEDHSSVYRKVLYEYSEFTKFFLNLKSCTLKEDLTKISISVLDEKHREHYLEISVNYTEKSKETFEMTTYDLPKRSFTEGLFEPNHSLAALFDQFLAQVELLQPYFDLMDEIDTSCSVLDPETPRKADSYRRIWLGENISLILTVDPYNVLTRPDIRFLGPDRLVDGFRTRLNENLGDWRSSNGVFEGVLDLLGLESFPQKSIKGKPVNLLVEYGECSICFCLRLNNQLPEVICKNQSCEKFYHVECLYEWLVSLNGRRVCDDICGKCPNCERTINCPIPIARVDP